jgi:hypothetical protein
MRSMSSDQVLNSWQKFVSVVSVAIRFNRSQTIALSKLKVGPQRTIATKG